MGSVVSYTKYKKAKGIAAPRSPYFTLNATQAELQSAIERAAECLSAPMDSSGRTPYAVLFGYEEKDGRVKLLKGLRCYMARETFERDAGRKNLRALTVARQ